MEQQTKKWFIRGLLLLIVLTMSCTCMPGSNNNNNNVDENEISAVTAAVEIEDTATPKPTNTEVVEPEDTVEPTLDEDAVATELAEILDGYGDVTLREWSVPVYPDSVFLLDDRDELKDWDDVVASQTRNLAIEAPYYYEFFELPATTKYADVRLFFNEEIPPLGYKTAADMQGMNEIYLLTFVNDGGSIKRKIVVQYWGIENMIMIIYKNPE